MPPLTIEESLFPFVLSDCRFSSRAPQSAPLSPGRLRCLMFPSSLPKGHKTRTHQQDELGAGIVSRRGASCWGRLGSVESRYLVGSDGFWVLSLLERCRWQGDSPFLS